MTNYSIRVRMHNALGETRLFEFMDFEDMISRSAPLVRDGWCINNIVRVQHDNYTISIGEDQ